MKFEVGDRVRNNVGKSGVVVEVVEANNTVYVEDVNGVTIYNEKELSHSVGKSRCKFDEEGPLDGYAEALNANVAEPNFHDSHYMELDVQPIDVIEQFTIEQRVGFYRGNAIKYLMRLGHKDAGLQEAEKALRYCGWLVKALKGEEVNPREL